MAAGIGLDEEVIAAWQTNNRVTAFLFENLPAELWPMAVPGVPRRTVRMIAGHVHNARCMWIKMLGGRHRSFEMSDQRFLPQIHRHQVAPVA